MSETNENKQYRRLIQKIQAYKTPDGSVFTNENDALENVKRQNLYDWCADQKITDPNTADLVQGKVIFEWIIENINELRKFL